jgi:uncharacterized protein (TIGR02145 family)
MMIQNISNRPLVFLLLFSLLVGIFFSACKKEKTIEPALETGTVTDVDGNVYKTVKIGNQWWMAENLKTKTFSDGRLILQQQNNTDWENANAAYCMYDNNNTAPGYLYNHEAVTSSGGLAPNGWRIPTDDDWKELEKHLGMSANEADKLTWRGTNEADKLKIEGPLGWTESDNVWGTNESGFMALAGSCRLPNGTYGYPGLFATGFWWTATEHNSAESYYRYLDYKESRVFRSYVSNKYGMSVRCVKN